MEKDAEIEKQPRSDAVKILLGTLTLMGLILIVYFLARLSVILVVLAAGLTDMIVGAIFAAIIGLAGIMMAVWFTINFMLIAIGIVLRSLSGKLSWLRRYYRLYRLGMLRTSMRFLAMSRGFHRTEW